MNRGCVSIGPGHCDNCQRVIEDSEQYLFREDEGYINQRWCVDCCLKKGLATYTVEKNEKVITFFT